MIGIILYKEISYIGDDIIDEATNAASLKKDRKKVPIAWKRWTAIAACLCLILCFTFLIPLMQKSINVHLPDSAQIFVGDILSQSKGLVGAGASTQAYFVQEAEKLSDLMKSPVKSSSEVPALTVYQTVTADDSKSYFTKKTQNIQNSAKDNLGISLTAENYTSYDEDYCYYSVDLMSENFSISMDTSDSIGTTATHYRIWDSDRPVQYLELFGSKIIITADESDESIKNKLTEALAFANKMFGTNCEIQSITRKPENSEEGYITVGVDAYENSADINQAMYNQYLGSMNFLFMGDNDDEIPLVGIYYTEYELENAFSENVELISVSEAEASLKNGYIFVGHVCPICMSNNTEVNFTNYDGLEIVYRTDTFGKYTIPFYAFYKKTGKYTFAIAYVPAVAVGGLQEYFEAQESWHNIDN